MSRNQVDDEFIALARALRRLAIAFQMVTSQERAPGSPADRDSKDSTFDGPWGVVGREVALQSAPWNFFARDHLFALAALVQADRVVAAQFTVARGVFEALATAYWFYDPEVDLRERVRRHLNLRLRRATETARLVGKETPELERIRNEARSAAGALDLEFTVPRARWRERSVGEPIPSSSGLVEALVLDSGTAEYSGVPYRFYSAAAHAGDHTIAHWVVDEAQSATPGAADLTLGISSPAMAAWLSPVPLAADAVVTRLAAYYQWDLAAWTRTFMRVVDEFRPLLDRQVAATSGTG